MRLIYIVYKDKRKGGDELCVCRVLHLRWWTNKQLLEGKRDMVCSRYGREVSMAERGRKSFYRILVMEMLDIPMDKGEWSMEQMVCAQTGRMMRIVDSSIFTTEVGKRGAVRRGCDQNRTNRGRR